MELATIRGPAKRRVSDHMGTHIDIYRNIYIALAPGGGRGNYRRLSSSSKSVKGEEDKYRRIIIEYYRYILELLFEALSNSFKYKIPLQYPDLSISITRPIFKEQIVYQENERRRYDT